MGGTGGLFSPMNFLKASFTACLYCDLVMMFSSASSRRLCRRCSELEVLQQWTAGKIAASLVEGDVDRGQRE